MRRWWSQIFAAQVQRGADAVYAEPEFGPAPYMHTMPHTIHSFSRVGHSSYCHCGNKLHFGSKKLKSRKKLQKSVSHDDSWMTVIQWQHQARTKIQVTPNSSSLPFRHKSVGVVDATVCRLSLRLKMHDNFFQSPFFQLCPVLWGRFFWGSKYFCDMCTKFGIWTHFKISGRGSDERCNVRYFAEILFRMVVIFSVLERQNRVLWWFGSAACPARHASMQRRQRSCGRGIP